MAHRPLEKNVKELGQAFGLWSYGFRSEVSRTDKQISYQASDTNLARKVPDRTIRQIFVRRVRVWLDLLELVFCGRLLTSCLFLLVFVLLFFLQGRREFVIRSLALCLYHRVPCLTDM